MPVTLSGNSARLTALLSGEIDHHSAGPLRARLDEAIAACHPQALRLDFDEVTFMDSSAIGLVMGRYRALSEHGGALEVVNLSPSALRMMRLSGLQSLAALRQKPAPANAGKQGGRAK
jgi:stage II sporulation protein AA (anti-sigma F factor antagonist)